MRSEHFGAIKYDRGSCSQKTGRTQLYTAFSLVYTKEKEGYNIQDSNVYCILNLSFWLTMTSTQKRLEKCNVNKSLGLNSWAYSTPNSSQIT